MIISFKLFSEGQRECLIDGAIIQHEQVFLDRFVDREVQSLTLHCVNHEHGCKWKGELRKREAHEAVCDYVKVLCVHSDCGKLVTRAQLADHLEQSCQYRLNTCQYCYAQVIIAAMKEHHETECPAVQIECTKCYRKDIPRGQMASHIDPVNGDCEGTTAPCPWSQIGCPESKAMKLQDRKDHDAKNVAVHMTLLFQTVMQLLSLVGIGSNLREPDHVNSKDVNIPCQKELERCVEQIEHALKENEELESKLLQQEQRIHQLESGGAGRNEPSPNLCVTGQESTIELSRRIHNEAAKTADLEVLIIEGNRQNEDLQRQVATLARSLEAAKETINRLQRQFESMSHSLALRNVTLSDLEEYVTQQEVTSHDGVLLWKISDFARRRRDAQSGAQVSFYSPCFFTSRYGYKMCGRIYLNGDGIGKGTHISIFFVVMRGQYDAMLRWPFRQKVTFMLLDQDNGEHVIDAFRPDPNSSSFQRPRRETNIASGCPTFCPLSELNNHAYVRDDTMFIKIIVGTADL